MGATMDPFAKPPTISDDYRMADIYRQSAEVFFEKGYESTTMAEIAESVDLTQGGLYYYIKGKKALLFAIMSYALDLLETEVLQPARRKEAPEACLRALIGGYLRLVCEEPSVMTLLAEKEEHLERLHAAKIKSRRRLFADFLRDVIASWRYEDGRGGAGVDPEQAVRHVIASIHDARTWNEGGRLGYDEMVTRVTQELLARPSREGDAALAS